MHGLKLKMWRQAHEIAGEVMDMLRERGQTGHAMTVAGLVFKWNDRLTTTAGRAKYATRTVELSWPIFREEENQHGFRNTVLHEIAHHLSPGGHHRRWRSTFLAIGGNGERCHRFKVTKRRSNSLELSCTGCGTTLRMGPVRQRRMQQGATYSCGRCRTPVRLVSLASRKIQQRARASRR